VTALELEIRYEGGILGSAATGAQALALEHVQMPLVRLGPHECNPFPSLTLVSRTLPGYRAGMPCLFYGDFNAPQPRLPF
jgi:hypothetical protein